MLMNSRNMVPGRDGQSNTFPEIISSVGPSLQNMYSPGQRIETDMLMKVSSDLHMISHCSYLHCSFKHVVSHFVSFLLCFPIGS
jgi:hypothetical protein